MSWRVNQSQSAILVVDVQEKILPAMKGADALLGPIVTLLKAAGILEVPVYLSEQYPQGLGRTVSQIAETAQAVKTFEKTTFSAGSFAEEIDQKTIILAGIETHICLRQTAYDLRAAGKTVVILADATASRREENHRIAMQELHTDNFLISSVEALLFEWVGDSQHEKFKEISELIKTSA
ncbi:MAG: isochorismatase family protein [Verrucomicrobiota bacterium]